MSDYERSRDLAAEENERISFVILQHIYSLGQEDDGAVPIGRIAHDLALSTERVVEIVAHLTYAGFLHWAGTGGRVRVADKTIEYIETLAHRRHSLRMDHQH